MVLMRPYLIKLISKFILSRENRHKFRKTMLEKQKHKYFLWLQKKYQKIIAKKKFSEKNKIRVAFLVVYDSVFASSPLYEKMLQDPLFSPFIVVIPDVARGYENMLYQMEKTFNNLSKKYENVLVGYQKNADTYWDMANKCDLMVMVNPYDIMTHNNFSIAHFAKCGVLPVFISYGFFPDYYARNHIINLDSLNMCWKVLVDTHDNWEDVKQYTFLKGANAVLTGYCKMDDIALVKEKARKRKKIIIAPHHTVSKEYEKTFAISRFLTYANFFLELPKRYPDIDFVFRPHPLLFVALRNQELWGEKKTDEYLQKMTANTNVEYQDGGDYFDSFVNSDAIIHDCSSFVVEYLFTGHPACYLLRDKEEITDIFMSLGQECLQHYYQAFDEGQIIEFIEEVVIKGNDSLQKERVGFVNQKLKINYPDVAGHIVKIIKESLVA